MVVVVVVVVVTVMVPLRGCGESWVFGHGRLGAGLPTRLRRD